MIIYTVLMQDRVYSWSQIINQLSTPSPGTINLRTACSAARYDARYKSNNRNSPLEKSVSYHRPRLSLLFVNHELHVQLKTFSLTELTLPELTR